MKNKYVNIIYALLVSLVFPVGVVWACPSCSEQLGNTQIGESLSVSVVAMSMLPFVLVGSVGASIYYQWRKHNIEIDKEIS